jgi:hypothetical protein
MAVATDDRPLETAWRVRGPLDQVIQCTIHESLLGFEVRVGQSPTDIAQKCTLATLHRARRKAARWRDALLSLTGFAEAGHEERIREQ